MKFLPENKKRIWIYLAVLLISALGVIYLNFFKGSSPVSVSSPSQSSSPPPPASSKLLPFGSKIDMSILGNPKFEVLKNVPGVTVSPEELGKTNLFAK